MTKKEINQIYYLSREAERLQDKLEKIRSQGLKSPKLDGMPRAAGGAGDPTGTKAVREADIQGQIEELLKRIQRKRREIFDYIAGLDDSLLRMIIIFRCVDLMTWQKVADSIGGPVTAESARKMFDRHFDKEIDVE